MGSAALQVRPYRASVSFFGKTAALAAPYRLFTNGILLLYRESCQAPMLFSGLLILRSANSALALTILAMRTASHTRHAYGEE